MGMPNNKKWILVLVYTLFIFSSLPWARQAWGIFVPSGGHFLMLCLYVSAVSFFYFYFRNLLLISLLVLVSVAVFQFINPPVVRIHVIQYGILGWMCYWAGGKKAFFYVTFVGILDEIVQKFLPNRVCDPVDVVINLISAYFGIFLCWYNKYNKEEL